MTHVQLKRIRGTAVAVQMAQLQVWLCKQTGSPLCRAVYLTGQVLSMDDTTLQNKDDIPDQSVQTRPEGIKRPVSRLT